MKKNHAQKIHRHLSIVHPAIYLSVAILSGAICLFALRANNEHMITLRDAVFVADKTSGDVNGSLKSLQSYVTAHMNTDLDTGKGSVYPPIQLKYTYDRLLQAADSSVQSQKTQLYTQAQIYCQQQDPVDFSGRNRVPCIENYVQSHNAAAAVIPVSLYEFSFTSPLWSPDLAGLSMILAIVGFGLFLLSLIARKVSKD